MSLTHETKSIIILRKIGLEEGHQTQDQYYCHYRTKKPKKKSRKDNPSLLNFG